MAAMRSLRRLRTPTAFARLTLVALAMLWVIVPSGAVVRLTASGLGCPDWPLCDGGVVPAVAGHAMIEYTQPRPVGARGGRRRPDLDRLPRARRRTRRAAPLVGRDPADLGRPDPAGRDHGPLGAPPAGRGLPLPAVDGGAGERHVPRAVAPTTGVRGRERGVGPPPRPAGRRGGRRRGGRAGHGRRGHRRRARTRATTTSSGAGATSCSPCAVHVRMAVVFAILAAVLVAWVWREGGVDRLTGRLDRARPSPGGAADRDRRVPVPPRAPVGGGGAARDHRRPRVGRDPGGLPRGGPPGPRAPITSAGTTPSGRGRSARRPAARASRPSGISAPQSTQIP